MALSPRARIALVVPSLGAGGAERVISIMANHWAARGIAVTVITIDSAESDFYSLDPTVSRAALDVAADSVGVRQALANNAQRISRLRSAIRDAHPDAVISFITSTNVLALIAGALEHVAVIVSERIDPTEEEASTVWRGLRRVLYPRAQAVVTQTAEVASWAEAFVPRARVHTIPNPVLPPTEAASDRELAAPSAARHRLVVAMGRLHPQKGFDVLLRAFAATRAEAPDWSLVILGDGEERPRLEALARTLGIDQYVDMPGRVRQPYATLRRADLFVLSSRYEGFPNALLEAMAVGAPVIATDCRSGPRHIVRHGIDGLLVRPDDVGELTVAMASLMGNDLQRRALGARAVEVRDRFSVDRVMGEWEQVLERVMPDVLRKESA